MKKIFVITAVVLGIILLVVLGIRLLSPNEPYYKGKPLSSWVRQLDDGNTRSGIPWETWHPNRSASQLEAADAIQHFGTNALPYLLQSITNQQVGLKWRAMKLLASLSPSRSSASDLPPRNRFHRTAELAFDVLGPVASPAIPQLANILTNPPRSGWNSQSEAAIALASAGPQGQEILIKLSSSNNWTGVCAIWALASHHVAVPPTMITNLLNNIRTNSMNGAISAWALGEFQQNPEVSIPALGNGLQSTDLGTRWGSALALGAWGTNATSAIPALTAALHGSDSTTADHAKAALKKIQPPKADRE